MTGHTTSGRSEGVAAARGLAVELTVERRRGLEWSATWPNRCYSGW